VNTFRAYGAGVFFSSAVFIFLPFAPDPPLSCRDLPRTTDNGATPPRRVLRARTFFCIQTLSPYIRVSSTVYPLLRADGRADGRRRAAGDGGRRRRAAGGRRTTAAGGGGRRTGTLNPPKALKQTLSTSAVYIVAKNISHRRTIQCKSNTETCDLANSHTNDSHKL
jgi:hypothetical protein